MCIRAQPIIGCILPKIRSMLVYVETNIKYIGFTFLASEPNWRSADRRYSPRTRTVQRLVRRGTVLKTLCKGQGQGQVRSPKVICWTG